MGGGPDTEHLLIALWEPEPKALTDKIRQRFPYFEITYVQLPLRPKATEDMGEHVPPELFQKATILLTLAALPPNKEAAPNLRIIQLFTAGVDHFAKHPIIADSDIIVTTVSGIHGPPIAEWVLMTSLVASRHFLKEYDWQREHKWGSDRDQIRTGTDWVDKTVGIAGYGSIGRQVAKLFTALGSSIHAYTATPRTTPEARADNGYFVPGTGDPDGTLPKAWYSGTDKTSLHTFLASGLDALVICLPLTPATRGSIGAEELALLGKQNTSVKNRSGRGALLVNIARGAIVDTPALVSALNDGTLFGAALDVTDPEPLPADHELWSAKNVIITPHSSSLGTEYGLRAFDLFMVNMERKERGERLFNVVERGRGY